MSTIQEDIAQDRDSVTIEQSGRNALIMDGQNAFTFEVADHVRNLDTYVPKSDSLDWSSLHYNVDGWRILPYGDTNDLPREVQVAVQNNAYAPGLLEQIVNLLWGKGPYIYTERKEGGTVHRDIVTGDAALDAWLDSWDWVNYILKSAESYSYMQGFFTKFFRNRGARVGEKPFVAKLEHTDLDCCRLANRYEIPSNVPTHIVETDFSFNSVSALTDMKVYPLFDVKDPFAVPTSMFYSNKYTFGSKNYTIPKIYGSLEWLRRSTAIPLILKALSQNSINIKYHVISPQEFWDQQEERLKEIASKAGRNYDASELEAYKKKLLKGVAKVLGGEENTGKFWHSTKILQVENNNLLEHGWEIKVIDQNIKDFVTAQIEVSKHSIQNLTAASGVHSANANVSETGKSDSGSEQLYAHQNHKLTRNAIPEMVVMKPMNMALAANFPGKGYKAGFLHEMPQRQQDLSESDRHKNLQ